LEGQATNAVFRSLQGYISKNCCLIFLQHRIERCNNKINVLLYLSKKRNCKNCGDLIGDESNSNEFGVEYELEHNRK